MDLINYDLEFNVNPNTKLFKVKGYIELKNIVNKVSFLLYKDLKVKKIKVENEIIDFKQEIKNLEDEKKFIVNNITFNYDSSYIKMYLEYEGNLNGYTNIMRYVKDNINKEFSIIRNDSLSYPIFSESNYKSLMKSYLSEFNYKVKIIVPEGYKAVCGGESLTTEQKNIFLYKSFSNRIDICIGKYKEEIDNELKKLSVNTFLKHDKSLSILKDIKKVYKFYSKIFNIEKEFFYKIIEVKDGYGSQSGNGYLLMESSLFDEKNTQLFHEIGHIFNPIPLDECEQRTRFFDEAFACYFEVIAIKEFLNEEKSIDKMLEYKKEFINNVKYDERNYFLSIYDYGKYELGYNSYSKGPWVLYLLHKKFGDELFYKLIKELLKSKITFEKFKKISEKIYKKDLTKFFDIWIYSSESSKFLCDNNTIEELINLSF